MNEDAQPNAPAGRPKPWSRLLKRLRLPDLAVLGLIALTALFYAIEDHRGWRAWQAERQRLEAKGEPLSWDELLPPPPPDEENLAAAPPYAWLLPAYAVRVPASSSIAAAGPVSQVMEEVSIDLAPRGYGQRRRATTTWLEGERLGLEAWAKHFREPELPDMVEIPFPRAPANAPPAQQVLTALSLYEDKFRAIEEAARRPRSRFPVRHEEGLFAQLPHLEVLKNHAEAVQLRGICRLRLGKTDEALADFRIVQRLADALNEDPILVSQMVRVRIQSAALQILWEGMAAHQWSAEQLQVMDRLLAGHNFLSDWQWAVRGERLMSWCMLENERRGRLHPDLMPADDASGLKGWFVQLFARALPDGWFWQNMTRLSRYLQENCIDIVDTNRLTVSWEIVNRADESRGGLRPTISSLVIETSVFFISRTVRSPAAGQALVHLARTAIALERHRLEHGQYPESLEALGGDPLWRRDPFDGQPLRYRREAPDAFVLYSIGRDRQDDGGVPQGVLDRRDSSRGDLVWRIPARPASAE